MFSVLPALVSASLAQEPAAIVDSAKRTQVELSLEKQRASLRRQMAAVVPVSGSTVNNWFTVPWESAPISEPAALSGPLPLDCPEVSADRLEGLIENSAGLQKLSPVLLREVIRQESGFQPCAVSSRGAVGLMQLMPETAGDLGVADAFDPEQNVSAGAKYLAGLLEKYKGDQRLALAAYNAGPERVEQYRGVPPFPETENYVREILARVAADGKQKQ
jgi:soluble lytic murein transglycosylase-like protein